MKTARSFRRWTAVIVVAAAFVGMIAGELPAAPPAVGAPQLLGPSAEALAQVDIEFSRLSAAEGAAKAFGVYLADNALEAFADTSHPADKAAILARLRQLDDMGLVFVWAPHRAETAQTGDFGYTFGKWELQKKSGEVVARGYYTSIWKRTDGAWKAIFDMGNQSPLEAK